MLYSDKTFTPPQIPFKLIKPKVKVAGVYDEDAKISRLK